jgi:GR25 family glycosyltransferase involved in LPS biosynthesis
MFSILGFDLADVGYFINLKESTDRLNHVNNLISKYEIKNFNRFDAQKDELVVYSCTKSHLKIFEKCLNENIEIVFIAEDDFDIEDICYNPHKKVSFQESLKKIYNDLKNVEWDVVMFGCNPKEDLTNVTENLVKVTNSTGSWCYLIKKRAYEYILKNSNYKRDYIAIDDYLPLLNTKGFITLTTIPMLVNHGVGFISTMQPNGPVDYNVWIRGNYDKHYYSIK